MTTQKTALIVGGTSGMGLETAKKLNNDGIRLILIGNNKERGEIAKKQLSPKTTLMYLDLYNQADLDELITTINKHQNHIAYLINAAGYFKPISFLEHTEKDYAMQMDINKAFFFITQAVANNMKEYGSGSIVNIGSMWAHQAIKATPSSAYSMQKAALHSLTKHLAMELAPHNIRANAVAPAVVLSTIYKSFIEEEKIPETLAGFNDFHPLGRIGTPEDIANAIYFLLSEKASWITGEILNIDGGVMSGRN